MRGGMSSFGDLIGMLTNHGMCDLTSVRVAKNKRCFVSRNGIWKSSPSPIMMAMDSVRTAPVATTTKAWWSLDPEF
jgi:hypothetical protein